jgi:hypothetical protein
MRDVDDWIRDLRGPTAPPEVPPWPRPARRLWAIAGLALAAVLLLALLGVPSAERRLRGNPVAPELDLRLAVDRGGVAIRATEGASCSVGERVFFRLSASVADEASVWVEGPAGRELIGTLAVSPEPRDLGDERGLTSYQFDEPGPYTFRASTEGWGVCRACPSVRVEVR